MFRITEQGTVEGIPENLPGWSGYAANVRQLSAAERQSLGWYSRTIEREGVAVPVVSPEEDAILVPPVPVLPVAIPYSKRRIRVALAARGLNDAFTAFLEASPELHQAWDDSVVLESTDPLFVQALSAFCSSAGVAASVLQEVLSESAAV